MARVLIENFETNQQAVAFGKWLAEQMPELQYDVYGVEHREQIAVKLATDVTYDGDLMVTAYWRNNEQRTD